MSQPSQQPPHNHAPTLPFADLVEHLFEPLKKGPDPTRFVTAPGLGRIQVKSKSATAYRDEHLETYFSKWRQEVGNDIYPVMRLICPHIDNERTVYGLKEQTIAKRIQKLLGLTDNNSDAKSLINWKNPGNTAASRMAGDFAGRCFEVMRKRPVKREYGSMRISEVNELLDKLAAVSKESEQLPILDEFYLHMSALELQWLIRIILKQMRVGASERSVLTAWHEDGMDLFNVKSDLREVCRQLSDPEVRLGEEDQKLCIMQNFMPQLAPTASNALTWDKIVDKLALPADDPTFWMEEKVDGERMQMHVHMDEHGDYHFRFWSRKGKDYTYLYGESLDDNNSALTRHLGNAFQGVPNCILDGEMVGFDPKKGEMVTFGTLKTHAIYAQANPHDEQSPRPLFRVFDLLLFNNKDFTDRPLQSRHELLEHVIKDVPGRFEIHPHQICTSPSEIEPYLRKIIQSSAEGIMLKNPHSPYKLNDRPFHWLKIKPDYMKEYGETLDCVVIGGYYGTGRRGGMLSSFLCGLRASKREIDDGTAHPEKFYSFFKVGGGIKAEDYTEIQRLLPEEKWENWNPKRAQQYIELAGGKRHAEKPDRWIRPSQSIVIQVKGASVEDSQSFSVQKTLRFPRFRSVRTDKSWTDALDIDEWKELQFKIKEEEANKMQIEFEKKRKRAPTKRQKIGLHLANENDAVTFEKSKLFEGMTFFIPSGSENLGMKQQELETLVREHGGSTAQRGERVAEGNAIGVGDRQTRLVQSLSKMEGVAFIVSPKWLVDCIKQQYILPYEDEHLYLAPDDMRALALENTDQYGDSYHRDLDADEMEKLFARMKEDRMSDGNSAAGFDNNAFYDQLEARGHELPRSSGFVFRRCRIYLAQVEGKEHRLTTARLRAWIRFGGGEVADDLDDGDVTHVVVVSDGDDEGARKVARDINTRVSERKSLKLPYVVTEQWLEKCWEEETPVSEDPYKP
ncbi:DNA ligase I [Diaporthe sp. PMI_573]|nr:DNA ligase I [Diaporthaceae sp. PMI_573]